MPRFISVLLASVALFAVFVSANVGNIGNPSSTAPSVDGDGGVVSGVAHVIVGPIGWQEPLLGSFNGGVVNNLNFFPPHANGWPGGVKARKVLGSSGTDYSYIEFAGASMSIGILPIGGHPSYSIDYNGSQVSYPASPSPLLFVPIVDSTLFDRVLTITIDGQPGYSLVPFASPSLRIGVSGIFYNFVLSGGEPGTSWRLDNSITLNSGWSSAGLAVTLDEAGDALIENIFNNAPRIFFRASFIAP